jgi:hypothetical protein
VRKCNKRVFKSPPNPKLLLVVIPTTQPKENPLMSFSSASKKNGKTYYLHSRQQTLRGGATVTLYYFASAPGAGAIDALPDGYVVTENERTGLPLLKKAK